MLTKLAAFRALPHSCRDGRDKAIRTAFRWRSVRTATTGTLSVAILCYLLFFGQSWIAFVDDNHPDFKGGRPLFWGGELLSACVRFTFSFNDNCYRYVAKYFELQPLQTLSFAAIIILGKRFIRIIPPEGSLLYRVTACMFVSGNYCSISTH